MAILAQRLGAQQKSLRFFLSGSAFVFGAVLLLLKYRWVSGLEYGDDMFHALQMALSPLEGRKLLNYSQIGPHVQGHHFYINLLLLGPFVSVIGVWAFLLTHVVLLVLAWNLATLSARLLLACPVALYLWDDFFGGWHSELLFVPLGVIFAHCRRIGSPSVFWPALFILLNKENGAIFLAAILFFEWILSGFRGSCFREICFTLSFFLFQLYLLNSFHDRFQELSGPIFHLLTNLPLRFILAEVFVGVALVLSGFVILLPYNPLRLVPCLLPSFVLAIISSLSYQYPVEFGPSWEPRLAETWGILAAASQYYTGRVSWRILATVIISQIVLLFVLEQWNLFERVKVAFAGPQIISIEDRNRLTLLAPMLPEPVAVEQRLAYLFHTRSFIFAYTRHEELKPGSIICSNKELSPFAPGTCLPHLTSLPFEECQFGEIRFRAPNAKELCRLVKSER